MSQVNTPAQEKAALAAEELLRRRQARQSLLGYTTYLQPWYQPDPFHRKLAEALDQVVERKIKRLIISAPPQHGKTQLTSINLPGYWLGRFPNQPVLLTCYGAPLANRNSRSARDIVDSEAYRRIFPDIVPSGKWASDEWYLGNGKRGYGKSAGVGGSITGSGAMLGIVDDPFKSWEEAQSETIRESVWYWFRGTFRTRIWEGGAIVIIMTRWHKDDMVGRLIKQDSERWTVLRLPAIAETSEEREKNNQYLGVNLEEAADPVEREPGEALAPNRFSITALEETKSEVGTIIWSAEYQGVPRPPEGNLFKRWMFQIADELPARITAFVRYWDLAGSDELDNADAAYTVGVLMAMVQQRKFRTFYVVDVQREQVSTHRRNRLMRVTAALDKARYGHVRTYFEQEPGSSGIDAAREIVSELSRYPVRPDRVTGGKLTRAMSYHAQCEAKNVYLLNKKWNEAYLEEVTSFPTYTWKDQVDASSGAFNALVKYQKATW